MSAQTLLDKNACNHGWPGITARQDIISLNPDAFIGLILRSARERQGLTLRQLSKIALMSRSTLQEIETGQRSLKVWELPILADALEISPLFVLDLISGRSGTLGKIEH